ncbi:MAG: protease modulator HflC [Arsenophonus sp.]|nr:MAG: protease modulator HflC [Arsenophonus sp.]
MRKKILFFLSIISFIITVYFSFFVVKPTEKAVLLRFGKILNNNNPIIYSSGLHVKVPFMDEHEILDARIQNLDIALERYLTRDNKYFILDFFLKWKIVDFVKYYNFTNENRMYHIDDLLKNRIKNFFYTEFRKLNFNELLNLNNHFYINQNNDYLNLNNKTKNINLNTNHLMYFQKINLNNQHMMFKLTNLTLFNIFFDSLIKELGIKIIDIKIKKIEVPQEFLNSFYQHIKIQRENLIREYHSKAKEEALKIHAIADRMVIEILAEAQKKAIELKGEADAIVTKLFADSFSKDFDFYIFIRSLRAYEKSFSKNNNDIVVLNPDINFFRYIKFSNKLINKTN